MESPAIIGFWGGMALLISSITGPGLTTIPLLFQQAGWLTPTIAFLAFGVISGSVSLFLVETMSTIHGNESFQSRVEYATVAHLYLGDKIHVFMQILLYCALQSVNISSIIISEQTMDSLLIKLFHKTCAISFTEGAVCVSEVSASGSPFNSYILFSIGYAISAALVIPLSMMSLVDNIKFQLASVATLFFIMVCWVVIFAQHGLDQEIPTIGSSQSSLIGFVLNNFAFITTVPSFINELSRNVSIQRVITYPVLICVTLYLIVGLLGAASYNISNSSDLLATLAASDQNKVLVIIVNILFPISALITSVPVFAIVIRYNLVRGNICSTKWATFWATWIPWILIIPFQTKGWLLEVMNWSSLIFGSSTNFIIPLLLYISSKTHPARTAEATGDLAPGDIYFVYGDSDPPRRSTHIVQREGDRIPEIITSFVDDNQHSQNIPTSPLLNIYSPSTRRSSTVNSKDSLEEIDLSSPNRHEASGPSNLDPSSIPLRVVYSPAVSRSGSVSHSHTDRPSIVLTHSDSQTSEIIPSIDENFSARHRSNSFETRSQADGNITRRSRHNSTASPSASNASNDNSLQVAINSACIQSPSLGSSNRQRRLTIEEVADDSSHHLHEYENENGVGEVFRAFPEKRYWKGTVVARVMLGVVSCCVLGNLIYTIVETARGQSPLGV